MRRNPRQRKVDLKVHLKDVGKGESVSERVRSKRTRHPKTRTGR